MRRSLVLASVLTAVLAVSACNDDPLAPYNPDDLGSYVWDLIQPEAEWERRAGLQVVELDNSLYLMGGRTPREPVGGTVIPGDSDLWSDVWRSDDTGATWTRILESTPGTHWPARAYFQALANGDDMYVIGGQNFITIPNPGCPVPAPDCPGFISVSQFFNDVWRSGDGVSWQLMTDDAGWEPRAGLTSVVFQGEIYVFGGSQNDDSAIIGGPPVRIYYNDVWKSGDGMTWEQVTASAAWSPRAGAAAVVKDGYIYLFGGEVGFICQPVPGCDPPYFNDVWRTQDGANWELVTADAGWPPRPGHQAHVLHDHIYLFGGFGQSQDPADPLGSDNPMDVWVSADGADWELVSMSPWNAMSSDDVKYDFAGITVDAAGPNSLPSILTFGGDREDFDFTDLTNYLNVDNDVWRFSPPVP
jgi:hypothetical protein